MTNEEALQDLNTAEQWVTLRSYPKKPTFYELKENDIDAVINKRSKR